MYMEEHSDFLLLFTFILLNFIVFQVFVKDTIVMRWFKLLSWLSPLVFVLPYGVARHFSVNDNEQWVTRGLLWVVSD